ncbi:MAG: recombinase zinc ribbon domain-containing protein [Desulfitobacteriaceae bacterium]
MSTGILRIFYASTAWTKCRNAFFTSKFGLCEDATAVQAEFERRSSMRGYSQTGKSAFTSEYAFSGKLFCQNCGSKFRRTKWGKGKNQQIVWICINHQLGSLFEVRRPCWINGLLAIPKTKPGGSDEEVCRFVMPINDFVFLRNRIYRSFTRYIL